MASTRFLPLTVLLSHFFQSGITGVLLSICLLINAPVNTTPPQNTFPIFAPETSPTSPAPSPPSPQGAPYLQQPPKEKAVEGEDVVLSCLLRSNGHEHQAVGTLRWHLQNAEGRRNVLQANETLGDALAGRVFFSGDLSLGDLSMMLRNVSVEDQGLYLCDFTSTNSAILQGGGTKLSIRKASGEESVGTIIGIVVAAVGVTMGLVAVILTQFKDKLNCLHK